MADQICGEVEEDTGRVCDKNEPCTYQHETDGEGWGVSALPDPKKKGGTRKQAAEIAEGIEVQQPVGAPTMDEIRPIYDDRGPQPATDDSVVPRNPAWVEETIEIFHEFLRGRGVSFTTAEDLWPLVPTPPVVDGKIGDRRTMQRVVSHALSQQWIEEIGAKRLRGTYVTKDGHEFRMNKLVSIYVSRIFSLEVVSSG